MFRKSLLIGTLVATVGALTAPEALARVCLLRSSSGSCTFWSGSTECEDLNASGVGNVKRDPKYMSCAVTPVSDANSVEGLVFCTNDGGGKAPGVRAYLVDGFSGFSSIYPSQVQRNGLATDIDVKAEASAAQLQQLDQFCQKAGWYAIDFVPCRMAVSVDVVDEDGKVLDSTTSECSLPQCETLKWDSKAQRPERRQYECLSN